MLVAYIYILVFFLGVVRQVVAIHNSAFGTSLPVSSEMDRDGPVKVLAKHSGLLVLDTVGLVIAAAGADMWLLWAVLATLTGILSVVGIFGLFLYQTHGRRPDLDRPPEDVEVARFRRRKRQILPVHALLLCLWVFAWRGLLS